MRAATLHATYFGYPVSDSAQKTVQCHARLTSSKHRTQSSRSEEMENCTSLELADPLRLYIDSGDFCREESNEPGDLQSTEPAPNKTQDLYGTNRWCLGDSDGCNGNVTFVHLTLSGPDGVQYSSGGVDSAAEGSHGLFACPLCVQVRAPGIPGVAEINPHDAVSGNTLTLFDATYTRKYSQHFCTERASFPKAHSRLKILQASDMPHRTSHVACSICHHIDNLSDRDDRSLVR